MALGQVVILAVTTFVLNYAVLFIGLASIVIISLDFYNRFWRINRDTDNVDLINRYGKLSLLRRYKL